MKLPTTYRPHLADHGEPDMVEHKYGDYITVYDYIQLQKKFVRARAEARKCKLKLALKNTK